MCPGRCRPTKGVITDVWLAGTETVSKFGVYHHLITLLTDDGSGQVGDVCVLC